MFEIRVYYQRYNMDYDYYSGDKCIKRRWKAKTKEELISKWKQHLKDFEGDTYSVWVGDEMILGGAYDPDDIDCIEEYLGMK